jgi:predicted DNA-binding transcriptional regulator AlpA
MPPDLTTRPVTAPVKDWLSEEEVLELVGNVSDRTLDKMIAAGQFPPGTRWPNGKLRWPWRSVAWFLLGMELGVGRPAPDDAGSEQERTATERRGTAR